MPNPDEGYSHPTLTLLKDERCYNKRIGIKTGNSKSLWKVVNNARDIHIETMPKDKRNVPIYVKSFFSISYCRISDIALKKITVVSF